MCVNKRSRNDINTAFMCESLKKGNSKQKKNALKLNCSKKKVNSHIRWLLYASVILMMIN